MNNSIPTGKADRPLIAHVIYRLDFGGLENGLVNLLNLLPEEDFRHAVICIDRSTEFRKRIRRGDVEIIEIRKKHGRDLAALWRLYQAIKKLNPDILHTRNLGALDALLPAALAGVKIRLHGEHGWDVGDLDGENRKLIWLRKLHSPLVSHFITVSSHLREYLLERIRIAPDRVTHICNGVDTKKFQPNQNVRSRRFKVADIFDENCFVIGSVGRIESVKNHMFLVNAFIELVKSNPECDHVRLAIIGDGSRLPDIRQSIEAAGLVDRCWLPGSREDIPEVLNCFDVYVQPSLAEGISNTILEAMASGLPIIASDVGGNPELVNHEETGYLYEPADYDALIDRILVYICDDARKTEHSRASRARAVDIFDIIEMTNKYASQYAKCLAV